MRAMSRLGLLSDPEGSGVYVGFIAGIIASNPAKAEALIAKMFPLSVEHHWAIVRAIAYSGRPEWQALMRRVAGRMPQRRVMIDRYLEGQAADARAGADREGRDLGREDARPAHAREVLSASRRAETKLDLTPDLLDTLWGYYYATGHYRPLVAHHPDAALVEGARRDREADPRQHGEIHACDQFGAQRATCSRT